LNKEPKFQSLLTYQKPPHSHTHIKMNESSRSETITKTRRNSYPKLKLKPLTLTLNRNCYSHKSYLNPITTPKPADSFTLSKVTDKLYLGSEKDVFLLTDAEVNEKNITRILSVQQNSIENQKFYPENEIIKDKFKNIKFMHVKASDVTSANLIDDFERCIDFIDENDEKGDDDNNLGATIVHCQAGISRSATVCLAYLIKKRGYTLDEAFEYLKNCRSCIGPNFGFLGQLKIFEQNLKQKNR